MTKKHAYGMGDATESIQPFETAPIYRTAESILREAHVITSRMSKAFKYETGTRLCDACLDLLLAVSTAYIENNNMQLKQQLMSKIEDACTPVLILHRIAYSLNLIERAKYVEQVSDITSVIKQLKGWRNAMDKAMMNKLTQTRPEHSDIRETMVSH